MIEDLREVIMVHGGNIAGRFAHKEVFVGFTFPTLPLMNFIIVDDFKQGVRFRPISKCIVMILVATPHTTR